MMIFNRLSTSSPSQDKRMLFWVSSRPETATDADYAGIENVIGHEYFHNWTGNRITCRDWFQLSLKEGLTVFRDHDLGTGPGSSC